MTDHSTLELAARMLRRGRLVYAAKAYSAEARRHPGSSEAWLGLGRALRQQRRWPEAEVCLRKVLALRPGWDAAVMELSDALRGQGRVEEAVTTLAGFVAAQPRHAAALLKVGGLRSAVGRFDEAHRDLSAAIALAPADAEAYLERMQVQLWRGNFTEAAADAERVIDLGLRSEGRFERLSFPFAEAAGRVKVGAGLGAAHRRLERFSRANPDSVWASFWQLGLAFELHHRREYAPLAAALSRLARGRYLWMRWLIGYACLRAQDWEGVIRECASVIRSYPWFLRGGFLIGEALIGSGHRDKAVAWLERLEPSDEGQRALWLSWIGEIHLRLGSYKRALPYLEQACRLGGGTYLALCWTWRGAANFKLGQRREALKDFDDAIARSPGDAEAYYWRALLLTSLGKAAEARRSLDAVLRTHKLPGVFLHRALLRRELDDRAGATQDLKRLAAVVRRRWTLPPGRRVRLLAQTSRWLQSGLVLGKAQALRKTAAELSDHELHFWSIPELSGSCGSVPIAPGL